jgi:hypothetical protein
MFVIPTVFASSTSTVTLPNGAQVLVRKGSHWPAEDPLVKQHPELFSTDPRFGMEYSVAPAGYDAPIEQVTAGPGEKRNVRR